MAAVRSATIIACLLTLASLIGTAGAQAAVRYASPNGAGSICSDAVPCSVVTAIEFAANGDEIVIGDGEYTLPSSLNAARSNLDIHAALGSRPSLTSGTAQLSAAIINTVARGGPTRA